MAARAPALMRRSPLPTAAAAGALAVGTLAVVVGAAGAVPIRAGEGPPMQLPVTARWCLGPPASSPCIGLEVPEGERQYAWGLQLRPRLPALRGMWFRFDPPVPARFWMHRTPEPLDMLFVREGRIVAIESASPCPRLPCRSYGPEEPVDGVVELAAGEAARLGLVVGGPARIERLSSGPRRAPAPD